MRRLCVIVAAVLAISACCDKRTKRIQPHWLRSYEGYQLYLLEIRRQDVQIPFTEGSDQRGNCFVDHLVEGCIATERYGFWLDVTNKSDKPIRLLWPEALYVDETTNKHTVYHYAIGEKPPAEVRTPGPPSELAPATRTKLVVSPGYKSYMAVEGCKSYFVFEEPLIPTRLDDKSETQMKAYVDDLAKRQVSVKVLLPIEIDGMRNDYLFSYVLRDRWADLPKQ